MFFEVLLFSLLGIGGGVLSGLIPGIHTNTLILLLFSILPLLAGVPIPAIIALIIAMAITHTLISYIPSVFLGAPESETALSVLPGHKMLLEGRGLEAIYLTVIGGVGVIILFVIASPLLLQVLPFLYSNIEHYIHWALIALVSFMIVIEGKKKFLWGLLVFFLAGLLGVITLNSTLLQPHFVFFPLFSGLFGISTLLISLRNKSKVKKQKRSFGIVKRSLAISGIIKGFFSGLVVGILPGVGSAQAGTLVQHLTRKANVREFLISIGGINTANALFALAALYTIDRARSGAAVAVERILGSFAFSDFLLLIAVALIVTGIAAVITLFLSRRFLTIVERLPYNKLSISIIILLVALTALFTGPIGLLVLAVSIAIGLIAPLTGVKRSLCMGVLILPVILFYSGLG